MLMLLAGENHLAQFRTHTDGNPVADPQFELHRLRKKYQNRQQFKRALLWVRSAGFCDFELEDEDSPTDSWYLQHLDIIDSTEDLAPPGFKATAEHVEAALKECGRGPVSIPIPWTVWRWLVRHATRGTFSAVVAACARCLYIYENGNMVKVEGRFTDSWAAGAFGVSGETIYRARKRLKALGWLDQVLPREHPNIVKKLGKLRAINPRWTNPEDEPVPATTRPDQVGQVSANHTVTDSVESVTDSVESGGPKVWSRVTDSVDSSNPNLLPNLYPNQSHIPRPSGPGETPGIQEGGMEGRKGKEPDIRNVVPEDLEDEDRVHKLYRQAVELGWLKDGEWERAETVRLARHCRTSPGITVNRCGVFRAKMEKGPPFNTVPARLEDQLDREKHRPGAYVAWKQENPGLDKSLPPPKSDHERRARLDERLLEMLKQDEKAKGGHAQRLAGAMA